MVTAVAGAGVFAVTGGVFWYCLPRDGKTHRLVGTEWELYVVAFCAAVALSFTMMLSGLLEILS